MASNVRSKAPTKSNPAREKGPARGSNTAAAKAHRGVSTPSRTTPGANARGVASGSPYSPGGRSQTNQAREAAKGTGISDRNLDEGLAGKRRPGNDDAGSYGPRTGKRTRGGSPALDEYYDDLVDNGGEVAGEDALMPRKGAPCPPMFKGGDSVIGSHPDAVRQRAATLDNTSANRGRPRVSKDAME